VIAKFVKDRIPLSLFRTADEQAVAIGGLIHRLVAFHIYYAARGLRSFQWVQFGSQGLFADGADDGWRGAACKCIGRQMINWVKL
jgi:hypothetical protein